MRSVPDSNEALVAAGCDSKEPLADDDDVVDLPPAERLNLDTFECVLPVDLPPPPEEQLAGSFSSHFE